MIEASYTVQIQMINTKGFLAISYALEKVGEERRRVLSVKLTFYC
jgi:hypothetical protein